MIENKNGLSLAIYGNEDKAFYPIEALIALDYAFRRTLRIKDSPAEFREGSAEEFLYGDQALGGGMDVEVAVEKDHLLVQPYLVRGADPLKVFRRLKTHMDERDYSVKLEERNGYF